MVDTVCKLQVHKIVSIELALSANVKMISHLQIDIFTISTFSTREEMAF
jgi:hypothetical protein